MKNIKACLSHNTDDWRTPSKLYNHFVNKLGFIDMFPYQCKEDQYSKTYENKRLYCNPPFSQLDRVVPYLIGLAEKGNDIMLLMPARTDTKYFHQLLSYQHCYIYFIKGRLRFNDCKPAPFPSILVYISKNNVVPMYFTFDMRFLYE